MAFNYKVMQIAAFFLADYNYRRVMVNGLLKEDEYYLFNKDNPYYQLIHIVSEPLETYYQDQEKNNAICELIGKNAKIKDLQFLEIHVCKDECTEDMNDLCICIDEDYYSGTDLSNLYPGIKSQVHAVLDAQKEKTALEKRINKAFFKRARKSIKVFSKEYIVTYILMAICVINFIVRSILVAKGYSESAVQVFVGGDYKTFTYGLKQFYRLVTYAFVHGSVTHLICNIYSLFILGRYIESKYGALKYLIILLGSVLSGSLVYGLFTTNGIIVGMSAFLYALIVMFVLEAVMERGNVSRSLVYILFLNIMLNFLPGVGWQAHLGGAVFGLVAYFMFKDKEVNKSYIVLAVVMLLVLGVKYYSNKTINPIYAGTDFEVCEMNEKLISEKAGNSLYMKLYKFYEGRGDYE